MTTTLGVRALGANINEFGRVGAHPHAPRRAGQCDPDAVPFPSSVRPGSMAVAAAPAAKPRRHRIDIPPLEEDGIDLRKKERDDIAAGVIRARLLLDRPRWKVGERLTVVQHWRAYRDEHKVRQEAYDAPLSVVLEEIRRTTLHALQKDDVIPLGHEKVTDFARAFLDEHDPAWRRAFGYHLGPLDWVPIFGPGSLVPAIELMEYWADVWGDTEVWLVRWYPEVPHEPRLLSGTPSAGPYASSSARAMSVVQPPPPGDRLRFRPEDAGEAIHLTKTQIDAARKKTAKAQAEHLAARAANRTARDARRSTRIQGAAA